VAPYASSDNQRLAVACRLHESEECGLRCGMAAWIGGEEGSSTGGRLQNAGCCLELRVAGDIDCMQQTCYAGKILQLVKPGQQRGGPGFRTEQGEGSGTGGKGLNRLID